MPEIEEKIGEYWRQIKLNDLVAKESKKRPRQFVFYDGPPFANGLPHYGHVLPISIKDAVVRFHLLLGEGVELKFGWDTHGLPVEYEIEKKLHLNSKKEILEMGVDKFNEACKQSVFEYVDEWNMFMQRLGRLGSTDNPYITMDKKYMESIWWIIKFVYDKGLLYRAFQSLPYCPRCATSLSNFETNQGYQDNVPSESVYVLFKINGGADEYLLAWTTTPWTLAGNVMLAVGPDIKYVKIKIAEGKHIGKIVWLAKDRLITVNTKYELLEEREYSGKELAEKYSQGYEPLYEEVKERVSKRSLEKKAYKITAASFVTVLDGTGIVHIAPAYGEDDLNIAKEIFGNDGAKDIVEASQHVDANGHIKGWLKDMAGAWVFDVDNIVKDRLRVDKKLYKEEKIKHTYPFCWRCDTPLIYYAVPSWYVAVSKVCSELTKNNQKINWVPEHLKDGRFGRWLEGARDWAISRQRFWGTPLPIWICQSCEKVMVFGSAQEVEGAATKKVEILDLHKPMIDEVEVKCECGGTGTRVSDVLDCWFESGSMPYAHQGFPGDFGGNLQKFVSSGRFPADFIAEAQDQTRGWFYTLHVLGTVLLNMPAFKNVIVNGMILAADGKKLSKRLKNYPDTSEVFSEIGSDSLRWFLLSSPAVEAEEARFSKEAVAEIMRQRLLTIYNIVEFFKNYISLHNIESIDLKWHNISVLDNWIESIANEALKNIKKDLNDYRIPKAVRAINEYVGNLSLWYVRRSRERVRADADITKAEAVINNLGAALYNLAHLIVPIAPFMAEYIFQTLKKHVEDLPKSIQLSTWPEVGQINEDLNKDMEMVRKIVSEILNARKTNNIPVRQPLAKAEIYGINLKTEKLTEMKQLIIAETNIMEVGFNKSGEFKVNLDINITKELQDEGAKRQIMRIVQDLRKQAEYALNDHIKVVFTTEDLRLNKISKSMAGIWKNRLLTDHVLDAYPDLDAEGEYQILGVNVKIGVAR